MRRSALIRYSERFCDEADNEMCQKCKSLFRISFRGRIPEFWLQISQISSKYLDILP